MIEKEKPLEQEKTAKQKKEEMTQRPKKKPLEILSNEDELGRNTSVIF
jgi:hypothetical protein